MLLENKNAIIYGGGSISGGVAQVFAREGAKVFLAGRNLAKLDKIAQEIRATDGQIETTQLDVLDEAAVAAYVDAVAAKAGSIDVSFNLTTFQDVQGTPLIEMKVEDLEQPVVSAIRAMFFTARAAARHMIKQGSGVILVFGGDGDPVPGYNLGGLQIAFGAMEYLRRGLSSELGLHGIRVITLQTGGIPETLPEDFEWREAVVKDMVGKTMLGRAATLEDVGQVAAFAASDMARSMTATVLNITCGSVVD